MRDPQQNPSTQKAAKCDIIYILSTKSAIEGCIKTNKHQPEQETRPPTVPFRNEQIYEKNKDVGLLVEAMQRNKNKQTKQVK